MKNVYSMYIQLFATFTPWYELLIVPCDILNKPWYDHVMSMSIHFVDGAIKVTL